MYNDDDGQFIFLWIAFNSAYANDTGEYKIVESRRFSKFSNRLVNQHFSQKLVPGILFTIPALANQILFKFLNSLIFISRICNARSPLVQSALSIK